MIFYGNILYFELWIKFTTFLSAFIANLEHIFFYQLSWIDLNILFPEFEWVLICFWSFKKLFIKFKQDFCNVTCHFYVYFAGFKQVFACKESSFVKVSNLYKCWKFTLQIIFFLFEWVVINISWAKFLADFHNYTGLNGLVNYFS